MNKKNINTYHFEEMYLCPECGCKVPVEIRKKKSVRSIKKEEIQFIHHVGFCKECNAEVPISELEIEETLIPVQRYCKEHDLVTLDEINEILRIYAADKRQLPFIMNVGEHTLERYMKGQIPNKEISSLLKSFLNDYKSFEELYYKNCTNPRITDNTRRKVQQSLERLKKLNSFEEKIEAVALYIINSGYEITNLALQKLLYYTNAIFLLTYETPLFEDDCEAWVHGPVYPSIYDKYKEFGHQQIQDCNLCSGYLKIFTNEEKKIMDYVLENLAIYNGKILEKSTHREQPWLELREGYLEYEPCSEIISKKAILQYFKKIRKDFNLLNEKDVYQYIQTVIKN